MRYSRALILLAVLGGFTAHAATPPAPVNYQGILRDSGDKPLTGIFDMTFGFCDAQSAGAQILLDAHTGAGAIGVSGGQFNVQLGSGAVSDGTGPGAYTGLDQVFRDYAAVWMEIVIGGQTLAPRVRVVGAPYALNASNLEGKNAASFINTSASGQTKTGALTLDTTASPGLALNVSAQFQGAIVSSNNSYAYLANNDQGVKASGSTYGGIFQNGSSGTFAYLGTPSYAVEGHGGPGTGGFFQDNLGDSAYTASFGYGLYANGSAYGLSGVGGTAGGLFSNTTGWAYTSVADGDYGIYAGGRWPGGAGGYFYDSAYSGKAWLGDHDLGIWAEGLQAGGYFKKPGSPAEVYLGASNGVTELGVYGLSGAGGAAGYFVNTASGVNATLGSGNAGIVAYGNDDGGQFHNRTTGAYALLAGVSGGGDYAGYFYHPPGVFVGLWTKLASESPVYFEGLASNGDKSFVQNHPLDPSRAIVYSVLEGAEAGTSTRGTARVDGGEARVALDPTFALTTDPDIGLTAVVTPRGQWAGLFVLSVSTRELVVRSHDPQADKVTFDYLVNGLRLGFENKPVVIPKDGVPNSPVPTLELAESALAGLPEDARRSTPLARYGASEQARPAVARPDLARARALIAAIDSPEQERYAASLPTHATREAAIASTTQGGRPDAPTGVSAKEIPTEHPIALPPPTALHLTIPMAVAERVEAGDVLANDALNPGGLRRAAVAADPGVFGIVAGEPGAAWEGEAPVALPGTVALVRVDASLGPIATNDLLVASPTRGHAMRAGDHPQPGTVIGKALEPFDAGTGTIRALVMSH